jgi:hypothetical protein
MTGAAVEQGRDLTKPHPAHRWQWMIWALGYLLLVVGCGSARSSQTFADRFAVVAGGGTHDSFQQHTVVVRNGRQEDATILVAPITVRANLAGYHGALRLRLLATPVFNIGDGIQMDVFLVNGSDRTRICSRYFDAGRNAADRQWIAMEVPLDFWNRQDSQVEVQVSGGPQGDLVADWLAIAEVRIESR